MALFGIKAFANGIKFRILRREVTLDCPGFARCPDANMDILIEGNAEEEPSVRGDLQPQRPKRWEESFLEPWREPGPTHAGISAR